MSDPALPFDVAATPPRVRLAMLAAWLAAAAFLIAHHVPWRDEVRALTLALNGDSLTAMLRGVRGEGHPAIWFVLLRVAYDLLGTKLVLQGVAAAVGIGAATLFALRAPFRWWMIALILFGGFFLFEYTVSARNYGIAMLFLFGAAAVPMRRGITVGLLLAAACNSNVGAIIPAGAMLVFRGVELWTTQGLARSPERRALLTAGLLAALGVLLCFLTVYPPVNDAAAATPPGGLGIGLAVSALTHPANGLYTLLPTWLGGSGAAALLLTMLLLAGPIGLSRTPGGLAGSVTGLAGLVLFHGLLYPGSYRHHALYLVLLIALHWMAARGGGGVWRRAPPIGTRVTSWGQWLTVILLALQVPASVTAIAQAATGRVYSNSRNLAALLQRPDLRDAVVIAEPDYLLEPLAYYDVRNPLWLMRERRYGRTVRYVKAVRRDLTLDDVLAEARKLRAATGRRVVIVIERALDPAATQTVTDGYVTTFSTDPKQVRDFHAAARRVAAFAGSESGEDYEVYVLGAAD